MDTDRNVVAYNIANFVSADRDWHFRLLSFAHEPLPGGYDLILCRDALEHLPYASIIAALENFASSSARCTSSLKWEQLA